jgi:energy-converting hydrogenase B subunit D
LSGASLFLGMRVLVLLFVAATGPAVVLTRDPVKQSVAVSFYGLVLALMFFLYRAPDVALSQIVVGAVALPLMVLLALTKIRRNAEMQRLREQRRDQESAT